MQAATLDTTKVTNHSPRQKRGFGEYNLWELWLLDKAEEILCGYAYISVTLLTSVKVLIGGPKELNSWLN